MKGLAFWIFFFQIFLLHFGYYIYFFIVTQYNTVIKSSFLLNCYWYVVILFYFAQKLAHFTATQTYSNMVLFLTQKYVIISSEGHKPIKI